MSKTVTAFFKGRVGVCESLYQYDYGRVMILDDIELDSPFDAYFETTEAVEAIPVIGQDNRVAIPNDCLIRNGVVTLHIPVHEGQNDSEVEYIVSFRVIGRARPIDDEDPSELQTAVSQAIALLQHPNYVLEHKIERLQSYKVNLPKDKYNQPDNGLSGQLLRTKGDGSTEWVDEGLPTDEQTAAAVSAWLDLHPEATTTVLDGSLTEAKLSSALKLKALKDYVTPEMFGAKGDGETDDAGSIQAAIDYANEHKMNVQFLGKTYLCKSSLVIPEGRTNLIGFDPRKSVITFDNVNGIICEAENNGDKFFSMKNLEVGGDAEVGISFARMSHNNLLNNCIVRGFATGVSLERCYVNEIINTLVVESTAYGIYEHICTVIRIIGGGINSMSGISYYEQSCFNNEIRQCDISAYSESAVDYCVYVKNGYGNIYTFYYEGNYANGYPLTAGICFDGCHCCNLMGGAITNNSTAPAVKLIGACKNVIIQDIYFNLGTYRANTVGILIESTTYECVVKNCAFNGFDTAIDLKTDIRVTLENIETLNTSYNKILVPENASVHLRLINVRQEMLPAAITTVAGTAVDVQCISMPTGKNWGYESYKSSLTTKVSGFTYHNTTKQRTEVWNGSMWIPLDGAVTTGDNTVKGLKTTIYRKGSMVFVNVWGTLSEALSPGGDVLYMAPTAPIKSENMFRTVLTDHYYSLIVDTTGSVMILPRANMAVDDIVRCSVCYITND